MEANGAIPPNIHFQPEPDLEPEFISEREGTNAKSPQGLSSLGIYPESVSSCSIFSGSDESMQDAPTPVVRTMRYLRQRSFDHFSCW
jgi:hypothetical protein